MHEPRAGAAQRHGSLHLRPAIARIGVRGRGEEVWPEGVQRWTAASRDVGDRVKAKRFDEVFRAGAKAERERIQAVEAQFLPGHEDLIAKLAFDGKTTGEQAAVAVLAAEKKKRAQPDEVKVEAPAKPFIAFRNTAANGRKS